MAIRVTYVGGTSARKWYTPAADPRKEPPIEHNAVDDCTKAEYKWGPITFPLKVSIVVDPEKAPKNLKPIYQHIHDKLKEGGNRFFKVEPVAIPVAGVEEAAAPVAKKRDRPRKVVSERPASSV